ncbi:MAG: tRNA threonylcarbamoyladenosine dehydratase [Bdellovibrionales bacterium]|jgi:tRNA A37 threonylcarbamoyladenosine dehydratase|nr:tRNA threonylcarbamoyladenosine dehydratase [Bdellovibrionales bacterium]
MIQENNMIPETKYVLHRRFDRIGRLVGDEAMEKLFKTHVMILGLGGVGSWAAESLARSGVGKITLVDFDEICITNANRQLHALQGMIGKKKAEVMAERLRKINPQAVVEGLSMFYNAETSAEILGRKPDYVVDAIDNLTAKCHLLATCRHTHQKIITSGGSAAKLDPLQVKLVDLAETEMDPMVAQVRKILRSRYDFPEGKFFGIPCVFSAEEPTLPRELNYDGGQGFKCVCPQGQNDLHSCEKRNLIYGTASFVTGTFGLVMASWVVREVLK